MHFATIVVPTSTKSGDTLAVRPPIYKQCRHAVLGDSDARRPEAHFPTMHP